MCFFTLNIRRNSHDVVSKQVYRSDLYIKIQQSYNNIDVSKLISISVLFDSVHQLELIFKPIQ